MAAQQQINGAQAQAQTQANRFEQQLIEEFRNELQPLVETIAHEKGIQNVLTSDAYIFWFDPESDITDEVIAAWRARPQESADTSVEELADEIADVETELEAVEEDLAEVEGELADAEEEIEELEEELEEVHEDAE